MSSHIRKIAVAGAFVAVSTAAVSVPASAATGVGGTPNAPVVLPVPPPAEDWWPYAGTGSF
jgi:hypothetical protein